MNQSSDMSTPDPIRRVSARGHELAVFEHDPEPAGDVPPLVLLHGIGMSAEMWPRLLPQAYARRRCIAVTLPAHYPGRAPAGFVERPVDAALFARELLGVIDAVIGRETGFDLLGHCLGGHATLAIAAIAPPERVRRLACVSGFVEGRLNGSLGCLQWLARRKRFGAAAYNAALATLLATPRMGGLSLLSATTRPRAFHRWASEKNLMPAMVAVVKHGDRAALRHLLAGLYDFDLKDVLCCIDAPTLIVHGTHDPIVAFAQARLVSDRVPNAELVSLDGIGHMPFGEAHAAFHQSINKWFDL